MREGTVLINFRLDKDRPVRFRWLATDGVPGDGYKPQVTAMRLADGARLRMDATAILEHAVRDPAGGDDAYLMTFNGILGYASDHPDRKHVDTFGNDAGGDAVDYEVEFIHEDSGRVAIDDEDFTILERPRARAHKI